MADVAERLAEEEAEDDRPQGAGDEHTSSGRAVLGNRGRSAGGRGARGRAAARRRRRRRPSRRPSAAGRAPSASSDRAAACAAGRGGGRGTRKAGRALGFASAPAARRRRLGSSSSTSSLAALSARARDEVRAPLPVAPSRRRRTCGLSRPRARSPRAARCRPTSRSRAARHAATRSEQRVQLLLRARELGRDFL